MMTQADAGPCNPWFDLTNKVEGKICCLDSRRPIEHHHDRFLQHNFNWWKHNTDVGKNIEKKL